MTYCTLAYRFITAMPLVLATLGSPCAAQSLTVTAIGLRTSVQAPAGLPVRLGQIASVDGPLAALLMEVVVLTADSAEGIITLDDVRRALADKGVNSAQMTLSGGQVEIRRDTPSAGLASGQATTNRNAMLADKQNAGAATTGFVGSTASSNSVRGQIAARLAGLYGTELTQIRITVDRSPSLSVLDYEPDAATSVLVVPGSTTSSTRLPVRVEISRPGVSVDIRVFTVLVELNRTVTVATSPIERGALIAEDALISEQRWIGTGGEAVLTPERVLGANAKRKIDAGRPITAADIQPPVVVQRGDLVRVQVVSGGISVKTQARALNQARDGEMVTLQSDGSKKTFTARMNGRLAIIEVAGSGSDPLPARAVAEMTASNDSGAPRIIKITE